MHVCDADEAELALASRYGVRGQGSPDVRMRSPPSSGHEVAGTLVGSVPAAPYPLTAPAVSPET